MSALNVMHYLPGWGFSGIETFALSLCEHVDRTGFNMMITYGKQDRAELERRAAVLGVPLYPFRTGEHLPAGGIRRELGLTQLAVTRVFELARLFRNRQVHVLHVHFVFGPAGFPAFLAARLARVQAVVVSDHTTQGWLTGHAGWSSALSLWLEKRMTARITVYYHGSAQVLVSAGFPAGCVAVVPHGVDMRRFKYDGGHAAPKGSIFRLIIVSRLVEGKGHIELLHALAQLTVRYPQLRLRIIGDGEMRSTIEAQCEVLGLGNVVELAGAVPHERVPELMRDGHVIVLPTYYRWESFPASLLEGMAMGMPGIGTRWYGVPDSIDDGVTGYVVEPRDVDSLTGAIEKLVRDPAGAAEMGRRAQLRVRDMFSVEVQARSMERIYKEAWAGKRC